MKPRIGSSGIWKTNLEPKIQGSYDHRNPNGCPQTSSKKWIKVLEHILGSNLFYLLQYATHWKRKCNPKNNSYLLAYDHRHPRGGVGVGCHCPPLHLVGRNLVSLPRHWIPWQGLVCMCKMTNACFKGCFVILKHTHIAFVSERGWRTIREFHTCSVQWTESCAHTTIDE